MCTLQTTCLQNSTKACTHVVSTLYAFVSKIAMLVDQRERIYRESAMCKGSQKTIQEADRGRMFECRPSVHMTHSFMSSLPHMAVGP